MTQRDRILSPPEVVARVGLSRRTVSRLVLQGKFPRPLQISDNRIGWRSSVIGKWILSLGETVSSTKNEGHHGHSAAKPIPRTKSTTSSRLGNDEVLNG